VVWGIMGFLFTITYRFVFSSPQLIKIFRFELCAKTCDTFQTPARPTIGARNIPAPLGFAIDQACVCDEPCILLLSHVWDSIFSSHQAAVHCSICDNIKGLVIDLHTNWELDLSIPLLLIHIMQAFPSAKLRYSFNPDANQLEI
jgi:hypothetical protein